jgi:nucleoside-diphosphate-sugar epimerase
MNGVDAVLLALGQDWRAVEAGAHAYAARDGHYGAMATWRAELAQPGHGGERGYLVGRMEIPLAVGTVGGVIRVHPVVQVSRRIAAIETAAELAAITAACGLAQNLGALRALAAEGIQSGHMRLHARNVAVEAGASESEVEAVATQIADRREVNLRAAKAALLELRGRDPRAEAGTRAPRGAPTSLDPGAFREAAPPLERSVRSSEVRELVPVRSSTEPRAHGPRAAEPRAIVRRPPTPPTPSLAPFASAARDDIRIEASKDRGETMTMTQTSTQYTPQPHRDLGGKVFVTGSAGHLGANLVRRLLEDGRDVRVLLREGSNNAALDGLDVEKVYGDLRDAKKLAQLMRGCQTAYHAAAMISTLTATPESEREIFECNVLGSRNLLRAAMENHYERVVVTGSFSAVGYDHRDPKRPSNEDDVFYPFDLTLPYGRTKVAVEHEALKACAEGLDVVIATSCAIVGPHDYKPSRMGLTLIDYANGKLSAYPPGGFDFVSSRDIAEGHVLVMHRGRRGQKYIVSTEFSTVDGLMDIFEEVSGRPRPRLRIPGPLMSGIAAMSELVLDTVAPSTPRRFTPAAVRFLRSERRADTTKAQVELGYKPTGIRKAIHQAYADFARRGLVPARPGTAVFDGALAQVSKRGAPARAKSESASAEALRAASGS